MNKTHPRKPQNIKPYTYYKTPDKSEKYTLHPFP